MLIATINQFDVSYRHSVQMHNFYLYLKTRLSHWQIRSCEMIARNERFAEKNGEAINMFHAERAQLSRNRSPLQRSDPRFKPWQVATDLRDPRPVDPRDRAFLFTNKNVSAPSPRRFLDPPSSPTRSAQSLPRIPPPYPLSALSHPRPHLSSSLFICARHPPLEPRLFVPYPGHARLLGARPLVG